MKSKHIELIELTICMVGGMESGARIYDAKICRNRAALPNSIKSRKVKGKDDKNLDGGGVGGWHSLQRR